MTNQTFIYRPYKTQTWAFIFVMLTGILAFIGCGCYLPLSVIAALCLLGVGVLCTCLAKVLYDSSKKTIFFEPKGLRIVGCGDAGHCYISWEALTNAYYVRSFKRHLFLVLSPEALSSKEAKSFANRGANSSRICIDSVVIIPIDILQDTSPLMELVNKLVEQGTISAKTLN